MAQKPSLPGEPHVDPGWFDLLKQVAARSSEAQPFATLVVVCATMVIIVLGSAAITVYGGYLIAGKRQQVKFAAIRRGESQ